MYLLSEKSTGNDKINTYKMKKEGHAKQFFIKNLNLFKLNLIINETSNDICNNAWNKLYEVTDKAN